MSFKTLVSSILISKTIKRWKFNNKSSKDENNKSK